MGNKVQTLLIKAESATENDASVNGAKRELSTVAKAREFFDSKIPDLRDLVKWNESSALSTYSLFDAEGRELERTKISEGDLIRISLKGSGKFDWVEVLDLYRGDDEAVLTVGPAADPTDRSADKAETSHFFHSGATNNFCLRHAGTTVEFVVIGLNERTNTDETGGMIETARNIATANLGYFLGIQKTEWTKFAESFLGNV